MICFSFFSFSESFRNFFFSGILKFYSRTTWYCLFAIREVGYAVDCFILETDIFLFGEVFFGYFFDDSFLSVTQMSDLPD